MMNSLPYSCSWILRFIITRLRAISNYSNLTGNFICETVVAVFNSLNKIKEVGILYIPVHSGNKSIERGFF